MELHVHSIHHLNENEQTEEYSIAVKNKIPDAMGDGVVENSSPNPATSSESSDGLAEGLGRISYASLLHCNET